MKFYQGEVVCDGKKWYAFCKDIPGQAVLREAPAKITLPMLQADTVLNQVLNKGFAGGSPQLLLLLEEKPLTILLDGVRDQDLVLDEPGRIGDYDCYRVRFSRNEGTGEYWIDQKTFVLRQMRFRQSAAAGPAKASQRRKAPAWWPISSGPDWEVQSMPWPSSSKCPMACSAIVPWWIRGPTN